MYSRLKKKVLYWCEACAETRADLEQHLKGSSHAKTVQSLEEKREEESTTSAEQPKPPLLSCDACPVKVGSEANLHLHKNLSGHAKESSVDDA